MTDPFEEAVRAAGRGLASSEPAPTYHGAWKRGRRRRLAKRSAIAVAGACALVVAFGTDIGRFQGGGTTIEVDDIASQTELVPAPTAPTFEPTTGPAAVPTTEPVLTDPSANATAPYLDLDDATAPATEAEAEVDPATDVEPAPTQVPPTAVPTVTPPPAVDPEPTVSPTPPPTPTPTPAIEPTPTPAAAATLDPDPTPTTEANTFADPNDPSDAAQSGPVDETPGTVDTLPPTDASPSDPQESANRLGLPADARIAPDTLPNGAEVKCDLDDDGVADGLCELLPMYRCAGADEVRAGYQGLDLDGDGAIDTCVAVVQTTCDTTGDGIGDVSCRIQEVAEENRDNEGP